MAYIVETIAADRRIQLGNESYVRKMSIGPYWQKIRIGIRFSINGRADINGGTLDAGFCVDSESHSGSDRSNGCFGNYASALGSIGYNAQQLNTSYYSLGLNGVYTFNMLNNVRTNTSMSLVNQVAYVPATPAPAGMVAYTWLRTGTSIAVVDTLYHQSGAGAVAGLSTSQFYQYMENENGVGMTNVFRATHSQVSMTTGSLFPYAFVRWSHSTPTIEITHIAVTRFY
jgi:hypothetical protein